MNIMSTMKHEMFWAVTNRTPNSISIPWCKQLVSSMCHPHITFCQTPFRLCPRPLRDLRAGWSARVCWRVMKPHAWVTASRLGARLGPGALPTSIVCSSESPRGNTCFPDGLSTVSWRHKVGSASSSPGTAGDHCRLLVSMFMTPRSIWTGADDKSQEIVTLWKGLILSREKGKEPPTRASHKFHGNRGLRDVCVWTSYKMNDLRMCFCCSCLFIVFSSDKVFLEAEFMNRTAFVGGEGTWEKNPFFYSVIVRWPIEACFFSKRLRPALKGQLSCKGRHSNHWLMRWNASSLYWHCRTLRYLWRISGVNAFILIHLAKSLRIS